MSNDFLIRMIKEKQADRTQVEAQLNPLMARKQALDIEINVLEQALEKANGKKTRSQKGSDGRRERALQEHWIKTLHFIGDKGKAHLNDIHAYINKTLGLDISEDTQRSQISTYVNKGWLNRVASGTVSLTESGALKSGYAGKKQEAPVVGASADEASTSSVNSGATQTEDDEDIIPF